MPINRDAKVTPMRLNINTEDWLDILKEPLYNREYYQNENGTLSFGQLVGQFLGVPDKIEDYSNTLYTIVHDQKLKIHLLTSDSMNKFISQENFHELQKIFLANQSYHFTIQKILALLDGKQLLPLMNNDYFNNLFKKAFVKVLNKFEHDHEKGFLDQSFRRVFIDMIKWSWNYIDKWYKEVVIEKETPRILWYGDGTKSNIYFLYLLIYLGCDLIIFNPEGKDLLRDFDDNEDILVHQYKNTDSISFPTQRIRQATIAYKASEKIERIVNEDETILYKPWQFLSYIPKGLTLKTTYDEVFLFLKEKAFIRPYFSIEKNEITIPNIFAKVSGVSENKHDYWQKIEDITSDELALLEKNLPLVDTFSLKKDYFHESLSSNGILNPKKMMKSSWWKYKDLHEGLQFAIATAITRLCVDPRLKAKPNETKQEVQAFLFSQGVSLPKRFIMLLQKYDYTQDIPRVVIYNNDKNGKLSRADAAILLLLNEIGFDILLYNPTGSRDLEDYIEDSNFDIHRLEEIVFDQEFKEASLIQRFLSKAIKSFKEE